MADSEPTYLGQWQRAFRDSGLSEGLMAFGFLLATYANADGTSIHPGNEALEDHTGKSKATVKRRIADLIEAKWIGQDAKAVGPGRNGGEGKAAVYRLTIPESGKNRGSNRKNRGSSEQNRGSNRKNRGSLRVSPHQYSYTNTSSPTQEHQSSASPEDCVANGRCRATWAWGKSCRHSLSSEAEWKAMVDRIAPPFE